MGKSYKKQEGASKRNIRRNLLAEWSKKDRAQLTTARKRLEGRVLKGGEGYFFKPNKNPSEEIYKIFIESVEGNTEYIEVELILVENINYKHHPENKTTWGKMRG